jgi:hypothetical protein
MDFSVRGGWIYGVRGARGPTVVNLLAIASKSVVFRPCLFVFFVSFVVGEKSS